MEYPHLFSPLTIKKTTFKNRILSSPVNCGGMFFQGRPTSEGINIYETRSRGGVAQVTVTETFVDFDRAARHRHGLDIVSPDLPPYNQEALCSLTEAIRVHGALASIQLNHVGEVNHPSEIKDNKNPIGPTSCIRDDGIAVDEMDESMMREVAGNFANAVGMAKAYGFDMVMLHGGHGWLLAQFLSPLTNKRTDTYGGSLENRARFPIMVLDRIREEVGSDFLLEYRISGSERIPGGLEVDEVAEFCRMIQGKVDLIHVTSGLYHNHIRSKAFSSMYHEHGCNLDLSEAVKKRVNIPVVAVGGFNHPQQMEDAIAAGKCDFAAIGRQILADADFAIKAQTDRTDEIAPCLRCSCFNPLPPDPDKRMIARPLECTVNPRSGRELRLQCAPRPCSAKDVLVIGGGPSGMYAAITSAEMGHKVTLVEKEKNLGGMLWFTEADCHKEDLKRYKDSLITRLDRLGVKVILGTEATPELIKRLEPYAGICAIGAEPIVPDIPGLRENAEHALWVYREPEKVGKRVIIIGGGLVGVETGMYLAELGHSVQVVEMLDDYAKDAQPSHREAIDMFMKDNMNITTGVRCLEVRGDGVRVVDKRGCETVFEADSVVYAAGMRPKKEETRKLGGAIKRFVPAGDCVTPAKVLEATRSAMFAAMDIL